MSISSFVFFFNFSFILQFHWAHVNFVCLITLLDTIKNGTIDNYFFFLYLFHLFFFSNPLSACQFRVLNDMWHTLYFYTTKKFIHKEANIGTERECSFFSGGKKPSTWRKNFSAFQLQLFQGITVSFLYNMHLIMEYLCSIQIFICFVRFKIFRSEKMDFWILDFFF